VRTCTRDACVSTNVCTHVQKKKSTHVRGSKYETDIHHADYLLHTPFKQKKGNEKTMRKKKEGKKRKADLDLPIIVDPVANVRCDALWLVCVWGGGHGGNRGGKCVRG
jgi:hypothetical protein